MRGYRPKARYRFEIKIKKLCRGHSLSSAKPNKPKPRHGHRSPRRGHICLGSGTFHRGTRFEGRPDPGGTNIIGGALSRSDHRPGGGAGER
jgi:hypothetical protein